MQLPPQAISVAFFRAAQKNIRAFFTPNFEANKKIGAAFGGDIGGVFGHPLKKFPGDLWGS